MGASPKGLPVFVVFFLGTSRESARFSLKKNHLSLLTFPPRITERGNRMMYHHIRCGRFRVSFPSKFLKLEWGKTEKWH